MAYLDIQPQAEQDIFSLDAYNYERVNDGLDFLSRQPRGAQTAGIRGVPEVRRAVAGKYLIFYIYDENVDVVYVLSVRHGARKPPTHMTLFPE